LLFVVGSLIAKALLLGDFVKNFANKSTKRYGGRHDALHCRGLRLESHH